MVTCGAEPLFFLDYFAASKLEPKSHAQIVKSIAKACKLSNCALLGGETAEMPGHYVGNNYDLAGFSVGVVEKAKLIDGKKIKAGQVLLAIESSGPHSNGYSLIRSIVKKKKPSQSIVNALLKPSLVRTEELKVKQKAQDVVDFLNLTHLSNELAGNLSGGQKKLLELGRTMMVDAKLVLLDEVGAGVNRTLLKDLGTAILKLNKEEGYTFCMIEHDMEFISRLCNPVIVMAEGSVLFEGTAEEAKKDEKVIESYLGRGSKIKDEN